MGTGVSCSILSASHCDLLKNVKTLFGKDGRGLSFRIDIARIGLSYRTSLVRMGTAVIVSQVRIELCRRGVSRSTGKIRLESNRLDPS